MSWFYFEFEGPIEHARHTYTAVLEGKKDAPTYRAAQQVDTQLLQRKVEYSKNLPVLSQ